ncbi:hypothetical protein F4781DRAFT_417803 [Annulohypoxylon bovei var. microspora]|nr:hypothetical protein F4781DRAFT_417803 [Annulohypoxylon bovei var. microspora]
MSCLLLCAWRLVGITKKRLHLNFQALLSLVLELYACWKPTNHLQSKGELHTIRSCIARYHRRYVSKIMISTYVVWYTNPLCKLYSMNRKTTLINCTASSSHVFGLVPAILATLDSVIG